ncbi:hypothetical protein LCGC14_0708070 [marine sediment metagenome]|uniref:Uncharacterized protein n=1 Tax=marine sediment metagenome TaxID=412755 RepID=A0A0F9R1A4_9ZZZZ
MKLIILVLVILFLISGAYAFNVKYSEPTYNDGHKIEWGKSIREQPIKENITKEEWNNIFEDYRRGEISKENAIEIISRVEIK